MYIQWTSSVIYLVTHILVPGTLFLTEVKATWKHIKNLIFVQTTCYQFVCPGVTGVTFSLFTSMYSVDLQAHYFAEAPHH